MVPDVILMTPDVPDDVPDVPDNINDDAPPIRDPVVRIPWTEHGDANLPLLRMRSTRSNTRVRKKVVHEGFQLPMLDIAEAQDSLSESL